MKIEEMSGSELVVAFNKLNPAKPVKRFASHSDGIRRLQAAMNKQPGSKPAPKAESVAKAPAPVTVGPKAAQAAPAQQAPVAAAPESGPRPGSKRGRLLAQLRSAEGVVREDAMKEYEWKATDFSDAINILRKRDGVNVVKGEDGVYRV